MCDPTAGLLTLGVLGLGANIVGQRQQAAEFKRAQREQDAFAAAQRQLAMRQQADDRKLSDEKRQSILQEAEEVAPTRVAQIQQAEDKQAESNIQALQQAQLLGDGSVGSGAVGSQSNEYLKARAEAAAKQTEQAIKLARLFGAQGAGQDAVATQMQGAIDHRLNQQALDAQRSSLHRGYDWMQDNLAVERDRARARYNPNKGAGWQALGGAMMNIGMGAAGQRLGGYFGRNAGKASILKNLF